MKFLVTADVDWIVGYLRYGHLEGIVEAESEEALKEMMKDKHFEDYLDLVVDDYKEEDYDYVKEYKYEEVKE